MSRRTIWVKEETYEALKSLKAHPRETFDDVIRRLLECYAKLKREEESACEKRPSA